VASMVETHGCMAATPSPKGAVVEQVAGVTETALGRQFGLVALRFGPWALNQVCCPHKELQISLMGHDHWSTRLTVN
jgi:hypothetical protein